MSDEVLTIQDNKKYEFNLGGNIKKFNKINEEFEKIRSEYIKTISNYYEEQDRKVLNYDR